MKIKKLGKIVLSVLIFFAVFVSQQVRADIALPSDYHLVQKCTKIDGINSSQDYYIVAYLDPTYSGSPQPYIVKDNECLEYKGYKHGFDFKLAAIPKTYLDQKGLQNIDFVKDNNLLPTNITEFYFSGYNVGVINTNPLVKEEYTYAIQAFSKKERILLFHKSQYIAEYNNDTPKKIEDYPITLIWSEDWTTKISDVPPAPTPSPTTTTSGLTSTPTSTTTISKNPSIPFLGNTGSSTMVLVIAGVLILICVGLYFILKKKNK